MPLNNWLQSMQEEKWLEYFRSKGYLLQSCPVKTLLNTIYKGTRLADGQCIAIKILSLDNSPEVVQAYNLRQDHMILKFHREVRLLNQVKNNPSMVTILDAGEMNGIPYHICGWVEGRSLQELLLVGASGLNHRQGLAIVLRAARSIQQLHELDIAHRDIAPDNLYVTAACQTCLIDFGMAEFLKEISADDAKRYIDHDIFATGLMLYELWIGEKVFSYGQPTLEKEIVQAFGCLDGLFQFSPVAESVKRAFVCDAWIAAHVANDLEPYSDMASLVTDLECLLALYS